MSASHKETRRLSNIQISLSEAQDLLDLMRRGVKKVDESITVYCGNARVEAEDPSDLGRSTVVSDVVKAFVLEAKAGEPYEEKVSVDCLSRRAVRIEVAGNAEEWVLGKLSIVARYLNARRRRPCLWLDGLSAFWLILCALGVVEAINYLWLRHPTHVDVFRVVKAACPYVRWGATAMAATIVARRTTAGSLLHVRPASAFRKDISRDVLLPVAGGLIANLFFYLIAKFL